MKKIFKLKAIQRIAGIIALVAVMGFSMAACDDDSGGGSTGGGGPPPPPPPPTYTFNSIVDFATWLKAQPANTFTAPYSVKLNVSGLGGSYNTAGSAGKALTDNSTKYVSLDLSGSTFTSIENEAFYGCTSLTSITVDANNSTYSSLDGILYNKLKTQIIHVPLKITGSVTIPNSITSIEKFAFSNRTSLTSVTIPESVISIGGAFNGCSSLTSITIPFVGNQKNGSTNTHFGYIFDLATEAGHRDNIPTSLKTVIITGSNSIGNMAFSNCISLTSVTIPDSVTSIGVQAFYGCKSLTSVTFATGSNIQDVDFGTVAFPEGDYGFGGDTLKSAYNTGKAGTYKRASSGTSTPWTKQ